MNDIKIVKIDEKEYPEELKKIKNPPPILYYRGVLPKPEEKCLAIVGTRRCSPYGQQVAQKISENLTENNVTIISGLAPGIDTFSHKAVVDKKGRTIAVLGTGLDEKSIYPQINLDLSKKIIDNGGCLISELPEGTKGSKFSFPKRNRIISGLSYAVLIIEAKEKSGSLITANYAKKQNKKILAIPGPIYSLNSYGPNMLIKNGAILITNINDILEELEIHQPEIISNLIIPEDNEEKIIIEAIRNEPLNIDKIIEKTKLSASVVTTKLALMEISGKIKNLKADTYSL